MKSQRGIEQATGTQLLDRTVAVIKLLGEVGEKGAKMAEIADGLGLKASTAHRIVSALERHGLIEREQATKRYRLGLALFSLGAAAADGTGLRPRLEPCGRPPQSAEPRPVGREEQRRRRDHEPREDPDVEPPGVGQVKQREGTEDREAGSLPQEQRNGEQIEQEAGIAEHER